MEINKIYHGDCLELMKDIPDNSIDCVITDPPYGMDYLSYHRIATPKFNKIENDKNILFFPRFIKESFRVLKNNTHAYVFCNDFHISDFRRISEEVGFIAKRALVWIKNNHTSGDLEGDYGNQTEFIIYLQKGRKKLNGKRHSNVLQYSKILSDEHPTEKPIELIKFLIEKSTKETDLILDSFVGSGTTCVACKLTDRNYIGIEKDKHYFDIAEKRINETLVNKRLFDL